MCIRDRSIIGYTNGSLVFAAEDYILTLKEGESGTIGYDLVDRIDPIEATKKMDAMLFTHYLQLNPLPSFHNKSEIIVLRTAAKYLRL